MSPSNFKGCIFVQIADSLWDSGADETLKTSSCAEILLETYQPLPFGEGIKGKGPKGLRGRARGALFIFCYIIQLALSPSSLRAAALRPSSWLLNRRG